MGKPPQRVSGGAKGVAAVAKSDAPVQRHHGANNPVAGLSGLWEAAVCKPFPAAPPRGPLLTGLLFSTATAAAVYYRTMPPGVAGGDSGELMCVAHELGTAHPPGYPSFTFLTKAAEVALLAVRPSLGVAMAQNIFNTAVSVAAVGALYMAAARLSGSPPCAAMAALAFGFAPNVWSYAVVTEVFALNNFCMCVVVWLVVEHWRAGEAGPRRGLARVAFSAFFCGFSLTNQHTSVLYVAPVALWVLLSDWRRHVAYVPTLVLLSVAFFGGLSPYLYLPWSSTHHVTTNSWGILNRWDGFWDHFFRKEYGTFSLASKESTYRINNFERAWRYFVWDMTEQLGPALFAVASAGFAIAAARLAVLAVIPALRRRRSATGSSQQRKKTKRETSAASPDAAVVGAAAAGAAASSDAGGSPQLPADALLLLVWLLYSNFFNYLSNLPIDRPLFFGVQQRFWLQPLIITAALVATASAAAMRALRVPSFAQLGICAAVVAIRATASFGARDEASNRYVRHFGRAILGALPPNALLLTKGDLMINAARAVQVTEHFREDVVIFDQELMTYEWYVELVRSRFPSVVIPGVAYYPGKPRHYSMRDLLDRNFVVKVPTVPVDAHLPAAEQAAAVRRLAAEAAGPGIAGGADLVPRRIFNAYGWKEGDPSTHGKYIIAPYGCIQEVLRVSDYERRQRDPVMAGAAAAELAASFPPLRPPRAVVESVRAAAREAGTTLSFDEAHAVVEERTATGPEPRHAAKAPRNPPVELTAAAARAVDGALGEAADAGRYMPLPRLGRYDATTWESVVRHDSFGAISNLASEYTKLQDAMKAGAKAGGGGTPSVVDFQRRVFAEGFEAVCGEGLTAIQAEETAALAPLRDAVVAAGGGGRKSGTGRHAPAKKTLAAAAAAFGAMKVICGMHIALVLYDDVARDEAVLRRFVYTHRNVAVVHQAFARVDGANATLLLAMADALERHVADAEALMPEDDLERNQPELQKLAAIVKQTRHQHQKEGRGE